MKNALFAAIVALCLPCAAQAGEADGEQLYLAHCATCHGIEGTGHGPMAGVMVIKPADLTQLRAGNGGDMPVIRIVRRIDGRDPLVSHGSPMPVYGDFFEGRDVVVKAANGQKIMTSQPVVNLLRYLETVQQP